MRLVAQRIEGGAGAASTAADERDLDLVAAGGKGVVAKLQCAHSGCRRRAFDKLPA